MKITKLVVASHNDGKVAEIKTLLFFRKKYKVQ